MRNLLLILPPLAGEGGRRRRRVGAFPEPIPPRFALLTQCKATLPFQGRDKKVGAAA